MVLESLAKLAELIISATYLFLPALIANAMPVIVVGNIMRRKTPINGGLVFVNGEPLLGGSKTWEGFTSGILGGMLVGVAIALLVSNPYWILYSIVMSLGAMIGDLANSFIKRRLHIKAGNPFIPLDQLSFILSSYALVKILGMDVLLGKEITLVHLSIMTYVALVLHPLANLIAYILKLKDRPW